MTGIPPTVGRTMDLGMFAFDLGTSAFARMCIRAPYAHASNAHESASAITHFGPVTAMNS
ncbi:MAG: hypothetical protein ACTHQQ_18255 [Solirubrobacteraceae bacterium]